MRSTVLRVLVVDDDELSRELLALLLDAEGHEVELAVSGEEALTKLRHTEAKRLAALDVILTDVQLPGMAGDALAKELRAAMPERAVLLAMSGSRPALKTLESYDGFLLKPFSIEEFQGKIDELETATNGADLDRHGTSSLVECEVEADEGSTSEFAALNEEVYSKLSETMPAEQLGQIFSMCIADTRVRIGLMAKLAAAGDEVSYRSTAHTIKGGCGFIGATELYRLAERAEHDGLGPESGRKIGTTRAAATLDQFSSACERLEGILDKRARD